MEAKTRRPDRSGPHRQQFNANKKIIFATESVCWICGEPVDKKLKSPDPMSKTVDHVIPVSKGGHPSALENLRLAHRRCNRAKGDKLYYEPPKPKEIKQNWTVDWHVY